MSIGLNSLLDIGKGALFANQAAIQTTGNNITNVNTPGYSRRTVRFDELPSLNYRPGQLGTGVVAAEIQRHFDTFVEAQYNEKFSYSSRYETQWNTLKSVDNLFNEASTSGINDALSQFFKDWQDISARPDDFATREAFLGRTENMLSLIRQTQTDLQNLQTGMDSFISQEVNEANEIMDQIADLNREIAENNIQGVNNTNELFDRRAMLVRELSGKLDIKTIDNGDGNFQIFTTGGHTLVDGVETFELKFEGPKTFTQLSNGSTFDGDITFEGSDDFEYTVEIVNSGPVDTTASAATFRVSLDGGKTWLQDENGNELHYEARPEGQKVQAGNLNIYFDAGSGNNLQAGDQFTIVPKRGLYWYETTSTAMNITPQQFFDGTDNNRRVMGGTLAGYFNFRDTNVGTYKGKLDAMAENFIWEVNRLHSQGAGLVKIGDASGTYSVNDPSLALGSNSSGLPWNTRLQEGNVEFHFYDSSTGELVSGASGPLDFDTGTAGIQNFDPATHSLNDVRDAINDTHGTYVTATVVNNQLRITSNSGYEFALGTDSAGIMAGLGINTLFKGSGAVDMSLNSAVKVNPSLIAAGRVNGAGEANELDGTTALALAGLKTKQVTITTPFQNATDQTLSEYYNTIVSTVGADTANAKFKYEYHEALATDLNERQEAVAGVNLDEEMSNLIKFQHSYTAAAKLVTTADRMLQTVIGLLQ